jgi:glucose/arabinose dehydrogenase
MARLLVMLARAAGGAAACGATARLSVVEGTGPHPVLTPPDDALFPTMHVVTARRWPAHASPDVAPDMEITAFARDLEHPRWVYVLPNGDVLVAETNGPERPDDNTGVKGWMFKRFQKQAGGGVPSANRITLLRDVDGDGSAEVRTTFASNLNSPFGMALVGDTLYIANTDGVVRFPYRTGDSVLATEPTKVVDLPAGTRNHHWTKNIIASPDGSRLYASVGSNSNIAEHGMDEEEGRAAIWEINLKTGAARMFATGLRNPVGMAWYDGKLWTAVNERDELGSDLVPDYMTVVEDGGFYGWPYSYFGRHVDSRVKPQRPDLVERARVPDYALGPHTASLGLAASPRGLAAGTAAAGLPERFREGMFVGQHGSWNRKPRSGYRVIFVPFANSKPAGMPLDVVTGFVTEDGDAYGRPVGVALDRRGALLVADDVGNTVWRVTTRHN